MLRYQQRALRLGARATAWSKRGSRDLARHRPFRLYTHELLGICLGKAAELALKVIDNRSVVTTDTVPREAEAMPIHLAIKTNQVISAVFVDC